MRSTHPQSAPPSGARPILGGEDLWVKVGLALFGALFALGLLVYGWGQLAGRLFGRGGPRTGLADTGRVLLELKDHLTDPARAWPSADRRLLPGPAAFYGALCLGLLALAAVAVGGLVLWRRVRGGTATARRRAGGRWCDRPAGRGPRPAGFSGARDARAEGYDGPALDAHPGPARWLLGRCEGQPLWTRPDTNLLVLGPPRSRKSSGLIRPNLLRWPSGYVVSSTRPEAYQWALEAWERLPERPVYVYDPAGLVGAPEAVSWWPWSGAERWDRAVSVARAMAAGLEDQATLNSRHFAEAAAELLAPLLHAAALASADPAELRRWVGGADLRQALSVLRDQGSATAAADLAAFDALPEDQGAGKAAIITTARRALSFTAREAVRENLAARPPLDLRRLVMEGAGLVVVSPRARMQELAPLMSALLAALIETCEEIAFTQDDGRLTQPFAFLLDELPSIAPIPELPALLASGGGFGMPVLAVAQDLSQLAKRWGEAEAQTIWDCVGARVVTPGAVDERTEHAAIRGAGELVELRRSRSDSHGHTQSVAGHGGAQQSAQEGWSESWEPVIRRGELARMPLGSALCLAGGLRPLYLELAGGPAPRTGAAVAAGVGETVDGRVQAGGAGAA